MGTNKRYDEATKRAALAECNAIGLHITAADFRRIGSAHNVTPSTLKDWFETEVDELEYSPCRVAQAEGPPGSFTMRDMQRRHPKLVAGGRLARGDTLFVVMDGDAYEAAVSAERVRLATIATNRAALGW